MPNRPQLFRLIIFLFVLMIGNSFLVGDNLPANIDKDDPGELKPAADLLKGAWKTTDNSGDQVLIFIDNYITHTAYSTSTKKFISTQGGKYRIDGNKLVINFEFSTINTNIIGTEVPFGFGVRDNKLTTDVNGGSLGLDQVRRWYRSTCR